MIVQVLVMDKVLYQDTVDYPGVPQGLISELERTWRVLELQEQGVQANVAVIVGSKMNLSNFHLFDTENF